MSINTTYTSVQRDQIIYLHISMDNETNKLDQYYEEIHKYLNNLIKQETNQIKPRSLQQIEEIIGHIINDLDIKFDPQIRTHGEFITWIKLWKVDIEKLYGRVEEDKAHLVSLLSDIAEPVENELYDKIWLLIQIDKQLLKTYENINKSLSNLQFSRRKITDLSNIIRVLSGIMLVIFRIYEIDINWNIGDNQNRKLLDDLTYWDLDTLDNLTRSLSSEKTKRKKQKTPTSELVKIFWSGKTET